ncbi:uncharacterized protein KRP23_10943 [Phytophthora ramorum]|uniref:uncharacterized protein n=1 Tax=Phytophthora ramorum TaxID=164328 RepID=UPI0030A97C09|nr:hypothetical protein KRP23_10943 [Phytophthora ramorum]
MNDVRLPPRAEELVKCFVGIHERIDYYVVAGNEDLWITQLCAPTYEEVAALFEGASAYTHPDLIRLLYRDDRYEAIRDRKVRLVDALESHSPRAVVEELSNTWTNSQQKIVHGAFYYLPLSYRRALLRTRVRSERSGWTESLTVSRRLRELCAYNFFSQRRSSDTSPWCRCYLVTLPLVTS